MPDVPLDIPTVLCLAGEPTGVNIPFSALSLTVDFVIDPHNDDDTGNSIIFFTYKGTCSRVVTSTYFNR